MENKYANPLLRLLAHSVDQLIGITVFILVVSPVFSSLTLTTILDSVLGSIVTLLYIGIVMPILYSYMISKLGGSPGKLLTGIRIETEEGNLPSLTRALFRTYIGHSVASVFLGFGYIYTFIDEKRRGWHDMTSGTVVVKSNPTGALIGLVASIGLIVINLVIAKDIVYKVIENKGAYRQIMIDINSEFLKDKSPKTEIKMRPPGAFIPEYSPNSGWTTYTGTNYPISFDYPPEYFVYDYTPEDAPLIDITLDTEFGAKENTPILTVKSEELTSDFPDYMNSKLKSVCPTSFESCKDPVTGPLENSIKVETTNRNYASINTYISNSEEDAVFTISMNARKKNSDFSEEEFELYDSLVQSFKFTSN